MKVAATLLFLASLVPQIAFAQGAALEATPGGAAPAGSTVTVKWSGPNGRGDFITVVQKGAAPSAYLDYRQTSDGRAPVNPVSLVLPAEPGGYEIRYVTGSPRRVLATVPYEVTAIAATVEGPASVAPDARFEVAWVGPNNGGDFVTIVAIGAAPRAYGSYVDARTGSTDEKTRRSVATLRAPAKPGAYELRYVQQGSRVIGTRPIDVVAATSTGSLPPTQPTVGPVVPVLTIPTLQTPAPIVSLETPPAVAPTATRSGAATMPTASPSPQAPAATAPSSAVDALAKMTPLGGLTAVPGATGAGVTPDKAVDPANFTAMQTADGTVLLTWAAVPGAGSYMVGGPGTNVGIAVAGTSHTVTGIQPGMHTWTVATIYAPGGILTTAEKWSKATTKVSSASEPRQIVIRESILVTDAPPSYPAPRVIEIRESIGVADNSVSREE